MSLSPSGKEVLSFGMDSAACVWDVQPFVSGERLKKTFQGACMGPEKNLIKVSCVCVCVCVCVFVCLPLSSPLSLCCVVYGLQNLLLFVAHHRGPAQCAWTPDGKHIGCGSGDRNVYVWNAFSQKLAYCLPGHKGCVNQVDFHPEEPIGACMRVCTSGCAIAFLCVRVSGCLPVFLS